MLFLGVDTGLNSTGVVTLNFSFDIVHKINIHVPKHFEYRPHKVNYVCDEFNSFIQGIKHRVVGCFMEDHVGIRVNRRSKSIYDINRLDGRFEEIIYQAGIPMAYIRVDHIKWVVDCNTRSPKEQIAINLREKYGVDFSDFEDSCDDIADAYILAFLCRNMAKYKADPKKFVAEDMTVGSILRNYSPFFNFRKVEEK